MPGDLPAPDPSAVPATQARPDGHRQPARRIAAAALVAVVLAGAGFLIGRGSAPATPSGSVTKAPSPPGSPKPAAADCPGAAARPATGSMNSPNAALAQFIGQEAGKRLAGNAPLNVDAAQVATLGNQVPKGAGVDACADRITFTTRAVSFVVEAVPPSNPDMTFRIAGLINPTVVVPLGATVTLEFINADHDEAHGWVITSARPPFAFGTAAPPALPGASAAVIGDPTAAGAGARTITFTASATGTYHYLCPMPGHAQMGMDGTFIVR
jgi:rusticyanin